MKTSLSYIISDVSFALCRFKPIFNDCPILRESMYQVHESLQCMYFSEYSEAVDFIRSALKKNDSPFRFSLNSISLDTVFVSDIKYVLLKASIRVS